MPTILDEPFTSSVWCCTPEALCNPPFNPQLPIRTCWWSGMGGGPGLASFARNGEISKLPKWSFENIDGDDDEEQEVTTVGWKELGGFGYEY